MQTSEIASIWINIVKYYV